MSKKLIAGGLAAAPVGFYYMIPRAVRWMFWSLSTTYGVMSVIHYFKEKYVAAGFTQDIQVLFTDFNPQSFVAGVFLTTLVYIIGRLK